MPVPDQRTTGPARPRTEPVRSWVAALLSVVIGLVVGTVALLWQGWSSVLSNGLVLPWGALLGALAVFGAALWWGLSSQVRWAPGLTGLIAFGLLGLVSVTGNDTFIPPLNTYVFKAAPGAAWSSVVVIAGTVVATLAALFITARMVPAAAPAARTRR